MLRASLTLWSVIIIPMFIFFRRATVDLTSSIAIWSIPAKGSSNNKNESVKITKSLINQFSLTSFQKTKGRLLSGGERRRTEIARALASNPKFILLDEPFAGIDPIAIEEIKSTISLLKKMNIGIIITDHNVKEALSIVDYGYIIYNGQIIKSGSPKEITSDKFVKKIYLGENYK